jgi:hypothetical protein
MKLETTSSFHNSAFMIGSLGDLGGLFFYHYRARHVLFGKLHEHRTLLIFIVVVHRKILGARAAARGSRCIVRERGFWRDLHLLDFSRFFF